MSFLFGLMHHHISDHFELGMFLCFTHHCSLPPLLCQVYDWSNLSDPNNPAPSPFHCLPVNPGYFGRTSWLSWFSRKKGRGRTGQEATLKQPRKLIFQTWNQIFGQVTRQWAWPTGTTQKESTSSAIYCKITISFGEILIFTSTVLGGFFCKFSNQDFLLFHNGIITLHCLGRWQIYRRGYFSFQNSSMTKNDCTVSIFSELTPQKSRFC